MANIELKDLEHIISNHFDGDKWKELCHQGNQCIFLGKPFAERNASNSFLYLMYLCMYVQGAYENNSSENLHIFFFIYIYTVSSL